MSYHPLDDIPNDTRCPHCRGLGYVKTPGEPYLDEPCGCDQPDDAWEHISEPAGRVLGALATELAETDAAGAENARRIADLEAREAAPVRPFSNAAE